MNEAELRRHGQRERHRPYGCLCGARYTRLDSLERHVKEKTSRDRRYPCTLCKKYQGLRPEHLKQHLRTTHKQGRETVEQPEPQHWPQGEVEPSPAAEIQPKHHTQVTTFTPVEHQTIPGLNTVAHQGTQWYAPCPVQGCGRVGPYGFLQEIDLNEHLVLFHGGLSVMHHCSESDATPSGFYAKEAYTQSASMACGFTQVLKETTVGPIAFGANFIMESEDHWAPRDDHRVGLNGELSTREQLGFDLDFGLGSDLNDNNDVDFMDNL
ncbi:hypothetical protein F4678DRAFT_263482 [Xylaria arbuscula]|nr:hypothetical protein F4678DRAFT_263482 [Xylaria arbuscula]